MADLAQIAEDEDLPISTIRPLDRVRHIEQVQRELERGSINLAAQHADTLWIDDRCYGVLSARRDALTGTPIEFTPADARPEAARVAELLGGTDVGPGEWSQICDPVALSEWSMWGLLVGIGIAELVWEWRAGMLWPRIKLWHPQFLTWDEGARSFMLTTATGNVILPRIDQQPRSDGHWLIYAPFGYRYGWLQSLVRPLSDLRLGRGWTRRDWLRYSEVHGQPTGKAIVPSNASDAEKRAYHRKVANRGSDAVILCEQDSDGNKFDFELVEAGAKSWEGFEASLNGINVDIAVAVLGQNLTTEVQGGSFAAAKVSDRVRGDILQRDARGIEAAIYHQVLTWWAGANFGDAGLAPRMGYLLDPPEDNKAEAEVHDLVSRSLGAYQAAGAPVDQRGLLEEFGVPMMAPVVAP